jgi:hypothetical protein
LEEKIWQGTRKSERKCKTKEDRGYLKGRKKGKNKGKKGASTAGGQKNHFCGKAREKYGFKTN